MSVSGASVPYNLTYKLLNGEPIAIDDLTFRTFAFCRKHARLRHVDGDREYYKHEGKPESQTTEVKLKPGTHRACAPLNVGNIELG